MRRKFLPILVATCTIPLLPMVGYSQVGTPVVQPGQVTGQVTQQGAAGGVITPAQPITPGQAVRANERTSNQAIESRQVHASSSATKDQGSIQDFFVTKMMLANKAEVELGQMAQDRAQSEEVKGFAQMLVQEHQQLNQQLAQLQGGGDSQNVQTQDGSRQVNPQSTDPQSQTNPRTTNARQLGQANAESTPGSNQGKTLSRSTGNQQVPQQLTTICQQTAAKHLEMAREMLGEHEGQDFDMGFLGLQIAKHAHVVAELQSIQNVGSPEFQQLVRTAEQKTSDHLAQAKSLANKLKDKKSNP